MPTFDECVEEAMIRYVDAQIELAEQERAA